MRVLVCGGRDFEDMNLVEKTMLQTMFEYDRFTEVLHGACCDKSGRLIGADALAELWAIRHEIPYRGMPAKWTQFSRAAGPIRNERMIVEGKPDLVIAFPGGRGTQNMVSLARAHGIEVIEVRA